MLKISVHADFQLRSFSLSLRDSLRKTPAKALLAAASMPPKAKRGVEMNKRGNLLTGLMVFGIAFALLFAACTPLDGDLDDIREKAWEENHGNDNFAPTNTPSVSVGGQVGTLPAVSNGSVYFPVGTTNIPDGIYPATLTGEPSLPAVTVQGGQVDINNNSGTLTIIGSGSTVQGTYNLTLTINGVTSKAFTLTIAQAGAKSVTIGGTQTGTINAGTSGQTATFSLSMVNILAAQTGTITWYTTNAGTTSTTAPANISVSSVTTGSTTITMTATGAAPAAKDYYFKIIIDGEQSNVGTLVIFGARSISIGTQSGTINTGTSGQNATFSLTVANFTSGLSGTVKWYTAVGGTSEGNIPTNISAGTITSSTTTITMTATGVAPAAGSYYFRVTIDGVQSNVGTLTISQPPLTGKPGITGDDWERATLTATAGTLNVTTGLTYQWWRGSTNIGTGTTYTVKVADKNSNITVTASHASYSGSQTSDAKAISDFTGIYDLTQLKGMVLTENYKLANDIILLNTDTWTTHPSSFSGVFDGNGKTITFVVPTIQPSGSDTANYYGLFRINVGEIRNLQVDGAFYLNSTSDTNYQMTYMGPVVAYNGMGGVIRNVCSSVTVGITNTGGSSCTVGGIAGVNYGTIRNSYYGGTGVSVDNTKMVNVGGIVGDDSSSSGGGILWCWSSATGSIYGKGTYVGAGGIAGVANNVQNCVVLVSTYIWAEGQTSPQPTNASRIAGIRSGTFSNNYGRTVATTVTSGAMRLLYGASVARAATSATDSADGINVAESTTTNNYDGSWWTGNSGPKWTTSINWGGVYNNDPGLDRPWKWNSLTNRPKLWFE